MGTSLTLISDLVSGEREMDKCIKGQRLQIEFGGYSEVIINIDTPTKDRLKYMTKMGTKKHKSL